MWKDLVIPNDGFSPVVTAKLMDTNHLPLKLQIAGGGGEAILNYEGSIG